MLDEPSDQGVHHEPARPRERPWLHVDLSASSCTDGLGAAASSVTGFGVGWGAQLLVRWLGDFE